MNLSKWSLDSPYDALVSRSVCTQDTDDRSLNRRNIYFVHSLRSTGVFSVDWPKYAHMIRARQDEAHLPAERATTLDGGAVCATVPHGTL